ncbi:hypothetical protein [Fluviispira multicolorata]|uniref:Uncharacterized protein n=1 Tax=Fluviispira multicolorata TaxID=2654512 RepID=A0A833JCD4_9BACT|nr:hypothetical protein [Fluviispira multicolorata]KAB8030673.1 hypothetical protein GCL57_06775 [Fluviispira multicolorata]
MRNVFIKLSIFLTLFLFQMRVYSDPEYIPPDPFLITGESVDTSIAEEISNKLGQLQDKNKEIRAKILALQDIFISKFKDRIELKVEIISDQKKELPQFGVIELNATLNNISIVNYSKPILFEKNMNLPLFFGPLPVGKYEIKIHAIIGQQSNNWPYVIPQGKWILDKEFIVNGTLKKPIQHITVLLKADTESGIPKFEVNQNNSEEKIE